MSDIIWEEFDENFDEYNGGALYAGKNEDESEFFAAGVIWLDAVGDEPEYFAAIASWYAGEEPYGDCDDVTDQYKAADAFGQIVDGDVYEKLGTYHTMEEAKEAVDNAIGID